MQVDWNNCTWFLVLSQMFMLDIFGKIAKIIKGNITHYHIT